MGPLVILVVLCLLVLGSLVKKIGLNSVAVLAIIFSALGFYCIYLFKLLFVDNVNIDIYNIDMHQYKPTEAELARDKGLKDKLLALRAKSSGNNCNNQGSFEYQDLEGVFNNELEDVKVEMESGLSDKKCLRLTQS